MWHELVVEGITRVLSGFPGFAPGVGGLDPIGEAERKVALDELTHEHAAVTEDRAAHKLWRQLLEPKLG